MSLAVPPLAARPEGAAGCGGLTLAEAIGLRVPLCYVVEPDVLWAECAIEALLEEHGRRREAEQGGREVMVARWTRSRKWITLGASFGFGLASPEEEPLARVDVVEELARLSGHLAGPGRQGGAHPMDGALLSVRGLHGEMDRPLAGEVLLDLLRQLSLRRATLLVELHSEPASCAAWPVAASLGPGLRLPCTGRLRYEGALAELCEAARGAGVEAPDSERVVAALDGLTRLQAEVAARIARAESERRGGAADLLVLLRAARERVCGVLAGTGA